mgnify:CR=1 FL=1
MPNGHEGTDNDDVHIQATVAVLNSTVESHDKALGEIFARLGRIERLIYIGLGGVLVMAGLVSIIGGKILRLLA